MFLRRTRQTGRRLSFHEKVCGFVEYRARIGALVLAAACTLTGCGPPDLQRTDVDVTWNVSPDPARVGSTTVSVTLTDAEGNPIEDAAVMLEGTMTHPGMRPVRTVGREVSPGRYEGVLELTMGGDWVLALEGELADGSTFRRDRALPGVSRE